MSKPETPYAYCIRISSDPGGHITDWLLRIPESDRQEFISLEIAWTKEVWSNDSKARSKIEGVCRDWIEERGGQRRWWARMYVAISDEQTRALPPVWP